VHAWSLAVFAAAAWQGRLIHSSIKSTYCQLLERCGVLDLLNAADTAGLQHPRHLAAQAGGEWQWRRRRAGVS